jgi:hypothetical protein
MVVESAVVVDEAHFVIVPRTVFGQRAATADDSLPLDAREDVVPSCQGPTS